jgi:transcriptional regulator with XRE-family HTH domain
MENNKKYRYTKQLIGMALRDGWTQKQIAETCRTQQSIVSSWKSGAAQAKESQLTKLLEIYGPRLRRKAFRIYHDLIEEESGEFRAHLIKVEGEVIFSFPFRNKNFCTQCHAESTTCSCRPRGKKIIATRKLVVHALGSGEFCGLIQSRLLKDQFQTQFPETNIFVTKVLGHFKVEELLKFCEFLEWSDDQDDSLLQKAEYLMLQMLVRKSLLEHGYPVAGVEEHVGY